MTDVVFFLDALSPRELTGSLERWHKGNMDAGVPRVTPRVMSSIYTGKTPEETGMMEVSKLGGVETPRPKKSTFIDQAVREEKAVLAMGLPFCVPFQGSNKHSLISGDAYGEVHTLPEQGHSVVDVPAPTADMVSDHPDEVYSSFLDQTRNYFTRFKEALRQVEPEVAFLGYRLIDSYCHFQHTESRDGKTYREHLIDHVESLIKEIESQIDGDILFFSDHGQTEMTDVFRVNRWLKEQGWLDYSIDYNFIDTMQEYQGGEQHPVNKRVENQITFEQPGVVLNEEDSQVVSDDPFDSCMTLLCDREDFNEEKFREDLLDTGMYRSVEYKWEKYNKEADYYEDMPDIIPDRAEGVFVSGNLHKEPIGMGYYRTGVHDWKACYGATCEINTPHGEGREGHITPEQMYDVIADFIDLDVQTAPVSKEELKQYTREEKQLIMEEL